MLYCNAMKLNGKHYSNVCCPRNGKQMCLVVRYGELGYSHCARQSHGKVKFLNLPARIPAKTGGILRTGILRAPIEAFAWIPCAVHIDVLDSRP